jgi:hypothetical protein
MFYIFCTEKQIEKWNSLLQVIICNLLIYSIPIIFILFKSDDLNHNLVFYWNYWLV